MILALDVGATHVKTGIVENGFVKDRLDEKTPKDFEEFLELLKKIIKHYKNVETLSIAIAGQVDMEKGILKHAPNLGWKNIDFVNILSKKLNKKIHLINDVRAITYGEFVYGGLKGVKNGVCVFVGTGIGGGVIIDSDIRFGCDSNLGEIGHIKLKPNGAKCTCGKKGCFEAYAGGYALGKYAKKLGFKSLKDLNKDDEKAKKVFDRFVLYMSYGLSSVINMLNPCKIVLGGGVMMGFSFLFEEIVNKTKSLSIGPSTEHLSIELSKLSQDGGILGAYAWAMRL